MQFIILCLSVISVSCQIIWSDCPTPSQVVSIIRTNCAHVQVPLFHAQPSNKKILYFIKKFVAVGQTNGQIWLISGGPGGSGLFLSSVIAGKLWTAFNGTYDIIVPDHRGCGHSTRFNCSQESYSGFDLENPPGKLWKGCLAEIMKNQNELLNAITPTQGINAISHSQLRMIFIMS